LTGLVLLAFLVVSPFLVPLVWAGVLAYASWPLAESIRARCGGRDTLAASLAVGLAALTLFAPVLWLGWVAQQEVGGVVRTLLAFVAAPPDVPEFLRGIPWLGDWLAQQRALLLADPQGVITALKAWFAAHAGDAAQLAGRPAEHGFGEVHAGHLPAEPGEVFEMAAGAAAQVQHAPGGGHDLLNEAHVVAKELGVPEVPVVAVGQRLAGEVLDDRRVVLPMGAGDQSPGTSRSSLAGGLGSGRGAHLFTCSPARLLCAVGRQR